MTLVELIEAFDSQVDLDWKPGANGSSIAGFKVNGVGYILQLSSTYINHTRINEASFYLADKKGDKSFTSDGTSLVPTTVYGIVVNGLLERLKEGLYSSVFFSAERRHSTSAEQHLVKLRLYEFAAKRLARKLGWELYLAPEEFLLLDGYQGDKFGRFTHWQEQVAEALGQQDTWPSIYR